MALSIRIIASIDGKKVPWEEVPAEQKRMIATKLNDDAMKAAGYEKKQIDKLSDEEWIKNKFRREYGRELDLENPQTFNEKLRNYSVPR